MKQWRVILAVAFVALVSAAIWVWHEGSQPADTEVARAEAPAPVQESRLPPPDDGAAGDPTPAAPASAPDEPGPDDASDGTQSTTTVAVDPPSVDTPEPAQRKFARGGHAESDQN